MVFPVSKLALSSGEFLYEAIFRTEETSFFEDLEWTFYTASRYTPWHHRIFAAHPSLLPENIILDVFSTVSEYSGQMASTQDRRSFAKIRVFLGGTLWWGVGGHVLTCDEVNFSKYNGFSWEKTTFHWQYANFVLIFRRVDFFPLYGSAQYWLRSAR